MFLVRIEHPARSKPDAGHSWVAKNSGARIEARVRQPEVEDLGSRFSGLGTCRCSARLHLDGSRCPHFLPSLDPQLSLPSGLPGLRWGGERRERLAEGDVMMEEGGVHALAWLRNPRQHLSFSTLTKRHGRP
eukprot:3934335-Rhodomonas_salina.1